MQPEPEPERNLTFSGDTNDRADESEGIISPEDYKRDLKFLEDIRVELQKKLFNLRPTLEIFDKSEKKFKKAPSDVRKLMKEGIPDQPQILESIEEAKKAIEQCVTSQADFTERFYTTILRAVDRLSNQNLPNGIPGEYFAAVDVANACNLAKSDTETTRAEIASEIDRLGAASTMLETTSKATTGKRKNSIPDRILGEINAFIVRANAFTRVLDMLISVLDDAADSHERYTSQHKLNERNRKALKNAADTAIGAVAEAALQEACIRLKSIHQYLIANNSIMDTCHQYLKGVGDFAEHVVNNATQIKDNPNLGDKPGLFQIRILKAFAYIDAAAGISRSVFSEASITPNLEAYRNKKAINLHINPPYGTEWLRVFHTYGAEIFQNLNTCQTYLNDAGVVGIEFLLDDEWQPNETCLRFEEELPEGQHGPSSLIWLTTYLNSLNALCDGLANELSNFDYALASYEGLA